MNRVSGTIQWLSRWHCGHDGPASLAFTRDYIRDFNREAKTAGTSENLIARMRELYPSVQDVLDNFILVNSAQVEIDGG